MRLCKVVIPEERFYWGYNGEKVVVKEREEYSGVIFHKWVESGGETLGLVEYKDGTVHKVKPEFIIFTDRTGEE